MLDSSVIPQANSLEDVIRSVEAVSRGARTYQDIAGAIGKGERQGRYYRLAGEQLGMLRLAGTNHSELTESGSEFLSLPEEARRLYLANAVLRNDAINEVYEYIVSHPHCVTEEIASHLISLDVKSSIASRRTSTMIRWLLELELINIDANNRYTVNFRPVYNGYAMEVQDTNGEPDNNQETQETYRSNSLVSEIRELNDIWDGSLSTEGDGQITFQVDAAARERASVNHQQLVTKMARALTRKNILPRSNRHIDLYAEDSDQEHIFEMKSCNSTNMLSQIRRGIAQLYEYRYRHNKPNATLWLVLEAEPLDGNEWVIHYLVEDRGINICWSLDEINFDCPPQCRNALNDLLF
ncbi:DUF7226 domain-containing protein [Amphibacillus cookii]|uniref:DUF7226 domain-containing protein n=1 Tax=Amphibacillus cookii TaxID=767787 RepID=UPI00195BDC76|nr:hypothetical protein [Amphibacillus cookii]MBM7541286.1 hypothetical protein [Amphibacillus cookii]